MQRILIIDDDAAIQLLYEEELSEEGYNIISSDGQKGLLQLIASKRPDLMLLDVKLRSRSGLGLLHDIRNAFHGIPVIVTTAYPTFEIDPKSVGADAYVTKNSDSTGLKQQIEKCLETPGLLHERGIIPDFTKLEKYGIPYLPVIFQTISRLWLPQSKSGVIW